MRMDLYWAMVKTGQIKSGKLRDTMGLMYVLNGERSKTLFIITSIDIPAWVLDSVPWLIIQSN